ncbi:MAG: hypothetical protein ACRCT8_05505, partial [Lacipirellulaceae bacterium]
KQALDVRDRFLAGWLTLRGVSVLRGRLQAQMARLVARPKSHAKNERFAKFLESHADQLFTFLRPEFLPPEFPRQGLPRQALPRRALVEATNWRAEQAIRPAVVNRRVWGGNRTDRGAHAQATLSTLLVTLAQQRLDPLLWLANARKSPLLLPLTG